MLSRLIIPQGNTFVTQMIIDINVLVYALMAVTNLSIYNFQSDALVHWGGNLRSLTMSGDWWRLVTCTFVHGGIMHLFSNMVAFVFVGLILEAVMGSFKFATAYLLTGIGASVASLLWHTNTVSVGASGAIFGMYGVIVYMLVTKVVPAGLTKIFLGITVIYIAYNLVRGATQGIDTPAHIGGLVSGVVAGWLLNSGAPKSETYNRQA